MFRHRTAVGRTQGTITRRAARRLLTALTATTVALGLLPLAAPSADAATYTITGRVTGLDATGAVVGVGDAGLWIYDATYQDAGSVTFSSDGTYSATFASPGPYRIEAGCWGTMTCASQWGIEWYADKGSFDDATPVTAGVTPAVANIRLDRRSTIKGTVKNTAGQPLSGFSVAASKTTGGMQVDTTSAADGSFTLSGVESGPSTVQAFDAADQHLYASATWDGTKSTSDYVDWTIPAGKTITGVNFVLDPWTGVVVKVTDAAGKPLENINWNLYEYRSAQGDWFGRQYGPLLTGADGIFAEQTEVGKTYKICVYDTWYGNGWAPATRYQDRCYDNATTLETATPFTVTSDTRKRELTMVLPVAGKGLTAAEPMVSGSSAVGSVLTVDPGAWGPSGVALSYQWMKYGTAGLVPIAGATASTFTTTSDLAGSYVTAKVTGTLPGYRAAEMYGNGVQVVGTLAAPTPTISGTKAVGYTLTAVPGAWGPAPVTLAYQWYRSGVAIAGATASTYALTTTDQAKTMTVRVTGTKSDYATAAKTSAASTAVLGGLTAPTPTISGTKAVGYTLTAVPGAWGPAPVTLAYQWYRSGVAVSGATASTYKLTTTDQAKTMTVRVTGARSGYLTVAKTSAATTAVLGAFTAPTPTMSGTRKVAYTLTAVPGTWSPAPTAYAYQWYRSGAAISGATARTYKLTSLDKGKYVKVRVTGARTGYLTRAVYSAQTAAIA
ncbi:carboxypeptidase regulatory-like domain-containing protein [Terrabacter sp. 2RAF25]|uniref:carboxypeptidase regulatory-like domain-containing protein n=1 Tax=Terrabacter sp. 2RAF25 TaxID=3232998 RepID=UPI003F963826